MKVSKSIEMPEGQIKFEGELNADEVDLILGVGLNYLMQQGALPFRVLPAKDAAKLVEPSLEEQ